MVIIAKDQPEYVPLAAAITPDGVVLTEWEPTADELERLCIGGRIRIWTHTFSQPFQPISVEVAEPECGNERELTVDDHCCAAEDRSRTRADIAEVVSSSRTVIPPDHASEEIALQWLMRNRSALEILIRQAGTVMPNPQMGDASGVSRDAKVGAHALRTASQALLRAAETLKNMTGQGLIARQIYEASKQADQTATDLLGEERS